MKAFLYWFIHITWGIITFIYGIIIALYMVITFHKPHIFGYQLYFISRLSGGWGFEAGPFFVLSADCGDNLSMKQHEHGHGVQTLWWGPLMLFVVIIPSFIRFWYRKVKLDRYGKQLENKIISRTEYNKIIKNFPKYDSIWFEHQATKLGQRFVR